MGNITTTTDQAIEQFLAKAEFEKPTSNRKRLLIAIDATASRQPTWDMASRVQGEMFLAAGRHGGLDVSVCYYRGWGEFKATRFFGSAAPLVQAMSKVLCAAGHTQLGRALKHAAREKPDAVVLIGDMCEEDLADLRPLAEELRRLTVPCYCFLEGRSPEGLAAFQMIAETTKGALLELNANSPENLKELLGAVAAFVTGGAAALADHRPEVVRLLTHGSKS